MRNTTPRSTSPTCRRLVQWAVFSCALLITSHWQGVLAKRAIVVNQRDGNSEVLRGDRDEVILDSINTGRSTNDEFEDELVQETINAGRGGRDEQGIRDQWLSDEHLGEESTYDSRKPISAKVQRLLQAYKLDCTGCDHNQAVRKVNNFLKRQADEQRKREQRDSWARKLFAALLVVGASYAYVNRKRLGLEFLLGNGRGNDNDDLQGFTEAQRANILRLRREQAATAATKRQQQEEQARAAPSWLENEQKEVWTSKQEKQFQKALQEFSGVPKKERYKLIAEKVNGKSRIECLTHHRMQELLEKRAQEEDQ